jgi:Secretion system C-terminal sorting domain
LDTDRGLTFSNGGASSYVIGGTTAQLLWIDSQTNTNDQTINYPARVEVTTYCNESNPTARRAVASRTFSIWLGSPNPIKILQPNFSSLCVGKIYGVTVQGGEGRTETIWTNETPSILQKVSEEYNTAFYRVINFGTAAISVKPKNACGEGVNVYFSAEVTNTCEGEYPCQPTRDRPCPLQFRLSPNPASHTVKIENLDANTQTMAFSYKIYNTLGNLLTTNQASHQTSLDISQWSDGIYTVLIQTENGVQALKLAVQKGNVAN